MEIILAIVIGVFGSGGFVAWYKARNDLKLGIRNSELDVDEKFMNRYEKEILKLNQEIDELETYVNQLTNALINHGINVPSKTKD